MMVRDCKHLIKLQHIRMEQTHSNYAKVSFKETVKYELLILMIMQIKISRTQFKKAMYSRSFIQNTNNRMLCIWKNQCIIKFDKEPARY